MALCVLPESRPSICLALSLSNGLPKISLSRVIIVSAPQIQFGGLFFIISITFCTFFTARLLAKSGGSIWFSGRLSSMSAGITQKGSPNSLKYSCRLGEAEAKMIVSIYGIVADFTKKNNRVGARRVAFAPLTPPYVRFSVYGGSIRSSYTTKWTFAKRADSDTKPLCSNRLFVIVAWIVTVPHTY